MRILLTGILVAAATSAVAAECPPGTWRQAAPFPQMRTEVAAASDGQSIYVVGGMATDPSTDLLEIFRYDADADKWLPFGRLDGPINHTGVAVVGGRLHVIGGYDGRSNAPVNRVRIYDLVTGAQSEGAPMPTARGGLAVAVLDGKIHALGGTTNASVATHEVYDPASNSWSSAAPMRVPRNHLAAAAMGGKVYAFGGRDEQTMLLDATEIYDAATDSWRNGAPLPTGRSGIAAAISGGRIVVFGGEVGGADGHTFGNAEAYDPASDSWAAEAPMPTPRHGVGVAAVGQEIYVVSGGPQPGLQVSDVNEVLCGPR